MDYGATVTGIRYADAETRGRLRQWKKKLARDYAVFNQAYNRKHETASVVLDMIKKGDAGRSRAFEKLTKILGPGLMLESVNLTQGRSLAVWSILKPRSSVSIEVNEDDPGKAASLMQDCVTVNYVVAGACKGAAILSEGLWTMEVPDHALGRAVERSGYLHPGKIITDAHHTLLALPITAGHAQPYLKAGDGCFVGELVVAKDVSLGELAWHFRVSTWLEQSMLRPDQIVQCDKGEPGKRFGDTIFLPRPLMS